MVSAHACRPRGAAGSSRPVARADANVSQSPSTTVVDAARLRHTRDITSVRSSGLVRSDRHLSLRARPNDVGSVRIAVSATRDLGTSVRRNRARRRVREALRQELRSHASAPGMDLVIAARRAAFDAPASVLRASLRRALAGLLGPIA